MQIPKYQSDKLSDSLMKSYLRKRIISMENGGDPIPGFLYLKLNTEQKKEVFRFKLLTGSIITGSIFLNSDDEIKNEFIDYLVNKSKIPEMSSDEKKIRQLLITDKTGEAIKIILNSNKIKDIRHFIDKVIDKNIIVNDK
jgi:hypothetical protein